ncbi:hypothetical protein KIL84_016532 [Mauremys mutica]|uniref:Uncharacterized protein n=1 Tax=Mauremys mutica TaxID=74926 RepID=A0A9D4AVY5_9SAUR|nr:hypothetical protein KIL84_016532 [Mauremys mutica]
MMATQSTHRAIISMTIAIYYWSDQVSIALGTVLTCGKAQSVPWRDDHPKCRQRLGRILRKNKRQSLIQHLIEHAQCLSELGPGKVLSTWQHPLTLAGVASAQHFSGSGP